MPLIHEMAAGREAGEYVVGDLFAEFFFEFFSFSHVSGEIDKAFARAVGPQEWNPDYV